MFKGGDGEPDDGADYDGGDGGDGPTHGAPVVGGGDGVEPLLAGSVPDLQLHLGGEVEGEGPSLRVRVTHLLPPQLDSLDFEVYPDGGDEGGVEGVFGEPDPMEISKKCYGEQFT